MYRATLGYYGKLPLSAEFIRCQASGAEIDDLDRWLREGMYHAKSQLGSAWSKDFAQGDPWGFLYMPRQGRRFLTGLIKPSQDKAGREFPFFVYVLLDREEFHELPWCAPMHFKEFFAQSYRVLADADAESDLARLQFRLQALTPVEEPEISSIESRYHAELLHRRLRDHWADLFGESENSGKCQVVRSLLQRGAGLNFSNPLQWIARFPLSSSSKDETYDLPFWMDVASHASDHKLDAGLLCWNRWRVSGKPVLFASLEYPNPQLLQYLIHPESWESGQAGVGTEGEELSDAARALLDDGEVTLEAFLQRVSCLRV